MCREQVNKALCTHCRPMMRENNLLFVQAPLWLLSEVSSLITEVHQLGKNMVIFVLETKLDPTLTNRQKQILPTIFHSGNGDHC